MNFSANFPIGGIDKPDNVLHNLSCSTDSLNRLIYYISEKFYGFVPIIHQNYRRKRLKRQVICK